jgi:hypothetical protein
MTKHFIADQSNHQNRCAWGARPYTNLVFGFSTYDFLGPSNDEDTMKKVITLGEAVKLVPSNCTLAVGGMTLYRRPMAFVFALLRQFIAQRQPADLTLLAFTASLESDLLLGAGMVRTVRSCYFGMEIFGLAPMFSYLASRGEIEIMEETEASLAYGLRGPNGRSRFHAWKSLDWYGFTASTS